MSTPKPKRVFKVPAPRKPTQSKTRVYPLAIVAAVVAMIELAMTVLYPHLGSPLERFLLLLVIIILPLSIVAAFIYLWVRKPGFLYPPSEFSGTPEHTRLLTCAYCGMHVDTQYDKSGDGMVLCHICKAQFEIEQKARPSDKPSQNAKRMDEREGD